MCEREREGMNEFSSESATLFGFEEKEKFESDEMGKERERERETNEMSRLRSVI